MSRKRNKGRAANPARKGRGLALASLAVIAVLVGGIAIVQMGGGNDEITVRLPRGGETHPVLSPQFFNGAARVAYTAAQKHPELLDQIYCYCQCDRPPLLHKSLLTCFATTHGAG